MTKSTAKTDYPFFYKSDRRRQLARFEAHQTVLSAIQTVRANWRRYHDLRADHGYDPGHGQSYHVGYRLRTLTSTSSPTLEYLRQGISTTIALSWITDCVGHACVLKLSKIIDDDIEVYQHTLWLDDGRQLDMLERKLELSLQSLQRMLTSSQGSKSSINARK